KSDCVCVDCGRLLTRRVPNKCKTIRCNACVRRRYRKIHGGIRKYSHRSRHFGVPYDGTVTRRKVLQRDHWRCQLCGVSTPERLSGTTHPNAPEVDHIVPLSAPGSPGHVWSNVQCACHTCNMAKGTTSRGQLRIF